MFTCIDVSQNGKEAFTLIFTSSTSIKIIIIDLARVKNEALVNNTYIKKNLNRVMLNGDGNENSIKIRASIKAGTWNIPEHSGTFRNMPEHPGT